MASPYAGHRLSSSFDPNAPPPPPPKPNSEQVSRQSTPITSDFPLSRPPPLENRPSPPTPALPNQPQQHPAPPQVEDPGPNWLPRMLEDKTTQDLKDILASPTLLSSLAHSPDTAHPSTLSSTLAVQTQLSSNISLTTHLTTTSAALQQQRDQTQAQLLSAHSLERQWRAKQSDMDRALAAFSPGGLYQRMGAGVQEQEGVCTAMEESFVMGDGGEEGRYSEREVVEWVRRYREQKKIYWKRREMKERWDEGRVGGWR